MRQKIRVTLDVGEAGKYVEERTYPTRDGNEVTVREVTFELVERNAMKHCTTITSDYGTSEMYETHFAAIPQTKQQRDAGEKTVYIGKGTQLFNIADKEARENPKPPQTDPAKDDIDDDIPF